MRLEMPAADRMLKRGTVASWLKAEGDTVTYGDDLCEILAKEVTVLKRMNSPSLLARFGRKGRSEHETFYRNRGGSYRRYRMRMTSSDRGVLRSIAVAEGSDFSVGDTLAVFSTTADEPLVAEPPTASFRVVVSPLYAEDLAE